MCLGCFQDVRWCHEKKSNPLRSIEKVFRWNRLKHHLNSQTPSSSPKLLLGQRMPRARGRSWGWEPCVCRKSTERSWDSTCNKVLACGPRPLQSPHSQNRRHSKGENSTTWCTIVCVAATVPTVQDMAGSIQWHDRFLMSHWWIFWRQRLISWRRQSEIQVPWVLRVCSWMFWIRSRLETTGC